MSELKYYLAFKLEPELEQRVAEAVTKHCSDLQPLEPVPLDRLHVTLLFLGSVRESVAKQVLIDGCAECPGEFSVTVGGASTFSNRVLMLQVFDSDGWLAPLRNAVVKAAGVHGLGSLTRGYTPHLTLAKTDQSYFGYHATFKGINALNTWQPARSKVKSVGLYYQSNLLHEVELTSADY
jgi:2'-5' RNA ligase